MHKLFALQGWCEEARNCSPHLQHALLVPDDCRGSKGSHGGGALVAGPGHFCAYILQNWE